MPQHEIRYFVAYSGGGLVGNAEITLAQPIRSIADVQAVARALATPQMPHPVVTGWQRFED